MSDGHFLGVEQGEDAIFHQPLLPAQIDGFCFQIPGRKQTGSAWVPPGISKKEIPI
jgi:hypothetical protein